MTAAEVGVIGVPMMLDTTVTNADGEYMDVEKNDILATKIGGRPYSQIHVTASSNIKEFLDEIAKNFEGGELAKDMIRTSSWKFAGIAATSARRSNPMGVTSFLRGIVNIPQEGNDDETRAGQVLIMTVPTDKTDFYGERKKKKPFVAKAVSFSEFINSMNVIVNITAAHENENQFKQLPFYNDWKKIDTGDGRTVFLHSFFKKNLVIGMVLAGAPQGEMQKVILDVA